MSSATEAEISGLYIMAHKAVYIRIILEELGPKQPPTPIQTIQLGLSPEALELNRAIGVVE